MPVTLDPVVALFSQRQEVRDAAWAKVVGPRSRVGRVVEGTPRPRVTLAVDPAVFGPAATPRRPAPPGRPHARSARLHRHADDRATSPGYTVPDGARRLPIPRRRPRRCRRRPRRPRRRRPDRTPSCRLADRLAAALRERPVIALPYADADVGARARSIPPTRPCAPSSGGRRSCREVLGEAARGDIAWPVDGLLPNGRESQLKTIWAGSTVEARRASSSTSAPSPRTPPTGRPAPVGWPPAARACSATTRVCRPSCPSGATPPRCCRPSATSRSRSCCSGSARARRAPRWSSRRAPTTPTRSAGRLPRGHVERALAPARRRDEPADRPGLRACRGPATSGPGPAVRGSRRPILTTTRLAPADDPARHDALGVGRARGRRGGRRDLRRAARRADEHAVALGSRGVDDAAGTRSSPTSRPRPGRFGSSRAASTCSRSTARCR